VKRTKTKYESKHKEWLDSIFSIPNISIKNVASDSAPVVGRPSISFHEKSDRSKRLEVAAISKKYNNDPLKLLMACRHAARISGQKNIAAVVKEILKSSTNSQKMLCEPTPVIIKMTPLEGLTYLLDRNMSKDDYISMRLIVKSRGADIFPTYAAIATAKAECRPPKEVFKKSQIMWQKFLCNLY